MMTKEELIRQLSFFTNPANSIGGTIHFIMKVGNGVEIKFPDIEAETQREMIQRIIGHLREKIVDNTEISLLKLSEDDNRKNVVYQYDFQDKPDGLDFMWSSSSVSFERFTFRNDHLDSITGFLIRIGIDDHVITLYKRQYPVNLLKRHRFLLVSSNSRLERIDKDALAFDPSFDFFVLDEELFVLQVGTLEKFFGFEETIKKAATQAVSAIGASRLLVSHGVLTTSAESKSFAKKLVKVRNSPVLTLPSTQVISFILNHPALKKKFKFNQLKTKINLTTKVAQNLFLKLLGDDYVYSQLTLRNYDSPSKDVVDDNDE